MEHPLAVFASSDPSPMGEDGNYTCPWLESILDAYEAYLRDKSTCPTLIEELDQTFQRVEHLYDDLQDLIDPADPAAPLLHSATEGLQEFLAGLAQLKKSIQPPNARLAQRALERLQQATNKVMDAHAFYQQPPPQVPLTTPNYQRLDLAIRQWNEGEVDDELLKLEIEAVEAKMLGHLRVNQAEMEDLEGLTEEEQELTTRLLGAIDSALQGSLQAIATMKRYWDDRQRQHVLQGLQQLLDPTQRMIEAFMALQAVTHPDDL